MGQFEKLFKEIIKPKDYKYNPALSYEENAGNLRRLALMEHNVKNIYETIEKIYGEEYATKLATLILNKSFIVTNLENYSNPKRPYITGKIELAECIHKNITTMYGHPYRHFNKFLHRISGKLISETREYGEVELYDFFICLTLYIELAKRVYTQNEDNLNSIIHDMCKQAISIISAQEGFSQPFTLCILDRRAFERTIFAKGCNTLRPGVSNNLFSIPDLDPERKEVYPQIRATYKNYTETVQCFLECYNSVYKEDGIKYTLPKIRIYADGINKLLPEIIEYISYDTGIDEGLIADVFNRVGMDSENPDLWSEAFHEAIEELEKIRKKPISLSRRVKKDRTKFGMLSWTEILLQVRYIFKQEYVNYLNISDRSLSYTLKKIEKLENKVPAIELILGNRIHRDTTTTFFKKLASEVTIEYKYLIEGCQSLEEYKERLRQAINDAQAINQTRFQIIGKNMSEYYRLNVKINEVEEDMLGDTYSVLKEETEKLKSIYTMPFTYELCIQKYFKDRSKKYFVLVK